MKKISILAIAAIAISFASCKKDRVCTCTFNDGSPGATTVNYTVTLKKTTKGAAKAACVNMKTTPSGQPYTEDVTCTVK
ncbi:MAG: hypothetical protein ACXVPN_05290 [Bacteroidia bacterium]